MDDVVNLAILLRGASSDVRTTVSVRVKTVYVALTEVHGGFTVYDPLGDRFAHTTGVCDPNCLRRPESAQLGRFAEDRESVSGEGE